jgi:hypothetical protein
LRHSLHGGKLRVILVVMRLCVKTQFSRVSNSLSKVINCVTLYIR